ncbi:MAG: alanine racemase [Candidatus Eremiobacteraeota bacterium]|nr:alanine racemase [Candidatus Eremiobacteraeota bacterium]
MIGEIRVSLDALRHNARTLRELVTPAKCAFVVKSNAYGHGLIDTALAIEPFADYVCVYGLEEALALRDGGITAPILVMGPIPLDALGDAFAAKVEIALWDTGSYARTAASTARKYGGAFPVHAKLNTGVARLGIEAQDAPDAIEDFLRIPDLRIAGIFSHLASAEELDSPFTLTQLDRFTKALAPIEPLLQERNIAPVRHIAASAAAMLWPQTRLDMVRIGIALYGLWPSAQTQQALGEQAITLQPALEFISTLCVIRDVAVGMPVGYGSTYHAPRTMRIGVVPLGYADGVPRALSNRGAFVVDGARCPIVGRVCMNMTMIDLTAAPNAAVGITVSLIGGPGSVRVSAEDWALWADTINYEIVARLPSEIPRSYFGEDEPIEKLVRAPQR